jgi:hypothetical protein
VRAQLEEEIQEAKRKKHQALLQNSKKQDTE